MSLPPLNPCIRPVKIFQAWYDDSSRSLLDSRLTPFFNPFITKYFADQVIFNLTESQMHAGSRYFGILSPRASDKCAGGVLPDLYQRIFANECASDFYYFAGCGEHVWRQGDAYHQVPLSEIARIVLKRVGFDLNLLSLECCPSYCSYQICRTSLYEEFLWQMLRPAIAVMDDGSDGTLQSLLNQDANYRDGRVSEDRLLELTGFPYYTLHPFISERLFPTYAAVRGWSGFSVF